MRAMVLVLTILAAACGGTEGSQSSQAALCSRTVAFVCCQANRLNAPPETRCMESREWLPCGDAIPAPTVVDAGPCG